MVEGCGILEDLIKEYQESLNDIEVHLNNSLDEDTAKLYRAIKSDLEYAIEWMKLRRQPYPKRDVSRLSYVQSERTIYSAPDVLEALAFQFHIPEPDPFAPRTETQELLDSVLSVLATREKEVFTTVFGQNISYDKCAVLLGVSKGTIQKHIERSRKKITQKVKELRSQGFKDVSNFKVKGA